MHLDSDRGGEQEDTARPELPSLASTSPCLPQCVPVQLGNSTANPSPPLPHPPPNTTINPAAVTAARASFDVLADSPFS